MEPDADGVSLGEYAEEECGLVGGFDMPVDEANEFCLAYARYQDQGDLAKAADEVPRALEDVVEVAPEFPGRPATPGHLGGRAVPEAEAVVLIAPLEAIDTVATAMCAVG